MFSYILTFQQIHKYFSAIATKLKAKYSDYQCNCTLLLHFNHSYVTAENDANIVQPCYPYKHYKVQLSGQHLGYSFSTAYEMSKSLSFCWDSLNGKPLTQCALRCYKLRNTKRKQVKRKMSSKYCKILDFYKLESCQC